MGLSRQEEWSGLPCPPPGDLPDPGIEPGSPVLQADSLLYAWGQIILCFEIFFCGGWGAGGGLSWALKDASTLTPGLYPPNADIK